MLAAKALQRLATLEVERNNLDLAALLFRSLLQKSPDWRQRTYASHWLQRLSRFAAAKEGLMKCGAEALAYALERQGQAAAAAGLRAAAPASMRGHSLLDLVELAAAAATSWSPSRSRPLICRGFRCRRSCISAPTLRAEAAITGCSTRPQAITSNCSTLNPNDA